jgi:phosphopantetheinyl transferase
MLMAGVCAAEGQAQVHAVAFLARATLFLDFWVLKEAYVKARGKGD